MEPISITIGTATALSLGGIALYKYIEQKIQRRRAYVALIDLSEPFCDVVPAAAYQKYRDKEKGKG